jgi:hypothetical protein
MSAYVKGVVSVRAGAIRRWKSILSDPAAPQRIAIFRIVSCAIDESFKSDEIVDLLGPPAFERRRMSDPDVVERAFRSPLPYATLLVRRRDGRLDSLLFRVGPNAPIGPGLYDVGDFWRALERAFSARAFQWQRGTSIDVPSRISPKSSDEETLEV